MRRGLADSRQQAAQAIAAGRVLVAGSVADKAARLVSADEALLVQGPPAPFVGRGGEKLDAALHHFGIDVAGRTALDAGASTGGFTDCLLQRGARLVAAVDVGRGQLHPRLRSDARVLVSEGTNVRSLPLAVTAAGPYDIVVADLAFISLRTVAGALAGPVAVEGADLVWLVKPQFEVGRVEASRGRGVISDPGLWRAAVEAVIDALVSAGAAIMGVMVSPIRGAQGNVEFLLHGRAHSGSSGHAADAADTHAIGAAGTAGTTAAGTVAGLDRALAAAGELIGEGA